MSYKISSSKEKIPKDFLFSKYKNHLKKNDNPKPKQLFYMKNFNDSKINKIQINNKISYDNSSITNNKNLNLSNHSKTPLNMKVKNISRIAYLKKLNPKIKKPKFTSQLTSLKYYLLYSKAGIGKKSLQNIYEDLDDIQKKIINYEENEERIIKTYKNLNTSNNQNNENKMVVNNPELSFKKKNLNSFLNLYGHFEKSQEFSKIRNLFGVRINLFEKREIIKKFMKNKELGNKTASNFNDINKKLKTFFPSIDNKNSKSKNKKENKSFDSDLFKVDHKSKRNNINNLNDIYRIISKNYLIKKKNYTMDNKIFYNRNEKINKKGQYIINKTLENIDNMVKKLYNEENEKNFEKNYKKIYRRIMKRHKNI